MAAKGEIENALRLQREEAQKQLDAERSSRAAVEDRAKRYALDGEVSRVLASQPLFRAAPSSSRSSGEVSSSSSPRATVSRCVRRHSSRSATSSRLNLPDPSTRTSSAPLTRAVGLPAPPVPTRPPRRHRRTWRPPPSQRNLARRSFCRCKRCKNPAGRSALESGGPDGPQCPVASATCLVVRQQSSVLLRNKPLEGKPAVARSATRTANAARR